ncbi:M48 family metalloprotease [Tenacibaculum finnmarkense]|uniref:M48 family metalloprotease n=1 Tax=Tenacibaculum finnmarkense TaxID=2781243 RepID=UPI001EFAAAAC|nr:M48 family metalloprotease [Tenacibaculum finnmarkense]MCG8207365.1 M48 family metalloprotease [Tenacibaculum finnmarkense genomovar finnmarkense]MCG8248335.1 M48 family metalloprotease [Tenacibaculum finnmarkense genomovar finnmarkense]MCG8722772.1 M48 family metalloprotease [Tenacibaculum finnmarkense]MCG8741038.1 M48 family metalloprotease [Tenacibaculum finnmarkense]MCG8764383.1 M48 family metalloprotease [Tenacibaculum finnmarkense]
MRNRGSLKIRLLIGAAIAIFALLKYCASAETNPYTGKKQHISISPKQEIAIGLSSAPHMAQQHGGLYPSQKYQDLVDQIGKKLVDNSIARESGYPFDFHLLKDERTINAFALPGGQVFITYALFSKLKNEDQLAGVLGHEIGHVIGRHSAARMAKQDLTQGLLSGASVGFDPSTAQGIAGIANVINMKYGRGDELESDDLGVKLMLDAGYNPESLIGVMQILKAAAGPNRTPEFQSTHPDPENRIEKIKSAIRKYRK